jgi:xanthine dehydrogenase accessory factor
MSHHLDSDRGYLAQLATSGLPYVGLLGPAHRREKLLRDIGPAADTLRGRLRAPIGLDLGGRSPEAIALAIVAELQAFFEGRSAQPFSAG